MQFRVQKLLVYWGCDLNLGSLIFQKILQLLGRCYVYINFKMCCACFKIINSNTVFPYKPSILGYPYFWKHPYAPSYGFVLFFLFQLQLVIFSNECIALKH